MNLIQKLEGEQLITPPKWLAGNVHYLTIMGSYAYGVSNNQSDTDVYGFCMPPINMIFPHLDGEISGFGRQKKRFDQYQQYHILTEKRQYDITAYSIIKYFQLTMENNPNMIDSLFTPPHAVLTQTAIGQMVREKRDLFLHRGSWHKFKGYAYSQLSKMTNKKNRTGKRLEIIEKHGYDIKFAYHLVRLLLEAEEILTEHTLTLDRNKEQLKAIRAGEWDEGRVRDFFHDKEKELEIVYNQSTLRVKPDEAAIKELLLKCIEQHYGSLTNFNYRNPTREKEIINQIRSLVN